MSDQTTTLGHNYPAHIAAKGRALSAGRTTFEVLRSAQAERTTGPLIRGGGQRQHRGLGAGATMAKDTAPRWDRKMQQRLARGEEAALGELYDRFASLVHGLAHRVLDDDEAAARATREVFAHVWENPDSFDPREGPLRSWIAALTQRVATGRLRQRQRGAGPYSPQQAERIEEKVRAAQTAARADYIVTSMPVSLRAALELAYFERHDYREAAQQLGVTEDEARRRLRLGLQLLSSAVTHPAGPPLPGGAAPTTAHPEPEGLPPDGAHRDPGSRWTAGDAGDARSADGTGSAGSAGAAGNEGVAGSAPTASRRGAGR
ncbi:hypothetical protein SCA03_21050 [Streptomyces cacaoi]|uniref:RNA polymerase sigma-70 region 2 domain-containing protein n=1 Tax=Streptomyces cacaoi TaxID=1898 RepID=A0A4Y3QVX8_STRCI|nr:hypothetical protein SCA03_21050 [Streptomyces cacaoi]